MDEVMRGIVAKRCLMTAMGLH